MAYLESKFQMKVRTLLKSENNFYESKQFQTVATKLNPRVYSVDQVYVSLKSIKYCEIGGDFIGNYIIK